MDIMLDLETLGKKPGCVILSIGAVAFDPLGNELPEPGNTGRCFYQNLTIFDQLLAGFTIDPDTLEWWRSDRVSPAAVTALGPEQISLEGALFRFVTWCGNLPGYTTASRVWAKSPDFDCAILEHAAAFYGVQLPWDFRGKADVRTLFHVDAMAHNGFQAAAPARTGATLHNALDDCFSQAAGVQASMKGLSNGTAP